MSLRDQNGIMALNVRRFPTPLYNRIKRLAESHGMEMKPFLVQLLTEVTEQMRPGKGKLKVEGKLVPVKVGIPVKAPSVHVPAKCQIQECQVCKLIGWSDPARGV